MSNWDPPGPNEPNAAGTGNFVGGNINASFPNFDKVTTQITALTAAMNDLRSTMAQFGQNQHQLGQGVANTLATVSSSSLGATDSIKTFFQSLTGARPGSSSMATVLDYGLGSGLGQDVAMFPLRYLQSTIGQNRQFALNVGGALAGQQYATGMQSTSGMATIGGGGARTVGLFEQLARTFGSGQAGIPMGTGEEIAQFMNIARQAGAMIDFTSNRAGLANTNPRAQGFVTGAWEMQQMNPAMPLGQIAATLGGFAANTAAQRQGAYLTGGAFSMIKGGGRMKSITEWAESILRWLESQRPGPKRGQGFTYEELLTQQYPGSNIDAWFDANGVPPDMQEQWWNYALAKARTSSSGSTIGAAMGIEKGLPLGPPNPAMQRLLATQPLTETSFGLAGKMGGVYSNREEVNAGFNRMLGSAMQTVIPRATTGKGPLAFAQLLPDPIEELLMTLMERTPVLGTALGGLAGWGAMGAAGGPALLENLFSEGGLVFGGLLQAAGISPAMSAALTEAIAQQFGDVGDIGDWTPQGSTTTSSLHPSMNRKVSAMMKANPRIRMNSGRRDEHTQRRLKARGFDRVSGKSSAHTRGLAADLGPRSEYPWIVANAHKYGLRSGQGHGEPWHVGMPGIGDMDLGGTDAPVDTPPATPPATTPTTPTTGGGTTTVPKPAPAAFTGVPGLGALLAMFGGAAGGEANVAGSMGGILNFLFGQFGGSMAAGALDEGALAYDPGLGRRMFAAGTYTTGGTYSAGNIMAAVRSAIVNKIVAAVSSAVAGAANTTGGSGSTTLAGALAAIGQSSTGLSDGAMVAKLASHVGFAGADLVTAVAIAGRESGFKPDAFNGDRSTGDQSYGLFQINMIDSMGPARRTAFGISKNEDLWDPVINLRAAHSMAYSRDTPFYDWGPYKGLAATYNTDVNAAQGYVREAGLGDMDGAYHPMSAAPSASSTSMQFHNTFVIQGSGGNGGIDTRRVVTMLADQLEGEMRRRMARSN